MGCSVIGLSGFAGVGKSTTAREICYLLQRLGQPAVVIPFAYPIKSIAKLHFGWDGLKDERGRRLLQTLGTEAGRTYNPNLWVNQWKAIALRHLATGVAVITDDVRFENEVRIIRSMDGKTINLQSSVRGDKTSDHWSERDMSYMVDVNLWSDKSAESVAADVLIACGFELDWVEKSKQNTTDPQAAEPEQQKQESEVKAE